ncbi:hypothetical protein TCAL_00538 [Tigriopus californicus]|uniref:Uncharacterized protein n=1 Tax=Tigriopus californicus TaxID=6832 RepID=A0A553PAY3_TIGCA|nr:guanine nucleotide-binding protein G(t) subunit alpha-3-like [Tigriopus californicus]TRY74846.1 hypothetical protein TCAL_00538 [Tigriopus californicus]
MGCAQSVDDETLRNRRINRELYRDYSTDAQIVKLLLLGAGESGKSTIVKQMKLLHAVNDRATTGFSDEEKVEAQRAIYANIMDSIVALIEAMENFGLKLNNNRLEEDKFKVLRFAMNNESHRPPEDVVMAMKNLWRDGVIQACYQRRNEFQMNDSAEYFLKDLDRVCSKDFIPNDQDVLRTRVITSGIVKIEFQFRKLRFHMFDVGGQRSERKKWIHCFDNVTAVLFIISLSEYDQVLFEDNQTNRMHESLNLFASIVNNIHFKTKPFIVFFNKKDLFEDKLKHKSIRIAFPDYTGDKSFESTSDFIIDKYLNQSQVSSKRRAIYPHLTTATDTELVNRVFTNVSDIILNDILKDIGLN